MSRSKHPKKPPKQSIQQPDTEPDWNHDCTVCGETPVVPASGMCGPCTFGEAETANGNW